MDPTITLNVAQAAELLFADPDTIMTLARQGKLPGAKIGKSWVFLRTDVLDYLRSRIREETKERLRRQSQPSTPTAIAQDRMLRPSRRRPVPLLPSCSESLAVLNTNDLS